VPGAAAAGGALSIVEASTSRIKFAAGAYTGALDSTPSSMAVFLYYLNVSEEQYCYLQAGPLLAGDLMAA
jgi:hypothetical protein